MILQNESMSYQQTDEFIPERWLKSDNSIESAKSAHPFTYMPFGFGPRMCIGRRFAELELETLMMRILRNFRVEWHHSDMKYLGRILNTPSGEIKFRFVDLD